MTDTFDPENLHNETSASITPSIEDLVLPIAILSGGLATRLYPVTEKIPKALISVAGKPFIAWQLDYLRKQGAKRVVLCLGHLGDQVQAYLGDGRSYGFELCYSWDGPQLRGTGGALRKAAPLLGERFFVFYGDSYLPVDFHAVERHFSRVGKSALMTVLENQDRWDKSNVLFRDGRIVEYNKHRPSPEMRHIDYGLGVLTSDVLLLRPENAPFDLAEVYHDLSVKGDLAGMEVFERFYEIGSQAGLQETDNFLARCR